MELEPRKQTQSIPFPDDGIGATGSLTYDNINESPNPFGQETIVEDTADSEENSFGFDDEDAEDHDSFDANKKLTSRTTAPSLNVSCY